MHWSSVISCGGLCSESSLESEFGATTARTLWCGCRVDVEELIRFIRVICKAVSQKVADCKSVLLPGGNKNDDEFGIPEDRDRHASFNTAIIREGKWRGHNSDSESEQLEPPEQAAETGVTGMLFGTFGAAHVDANDTVARADMHKLETIGTSWQ
ncbi:uncharacterized protein LACBIDRAFT_331052 [Laccaria bicolor S238N-H82]|uniref:Predicted protein n=1 Tax=Laccaria bicolor (strain S238N-H82 / ATCC MYA-4686) TaxID=486041 RepID=B0DNA3_LACBS|nr:uncharacterized protein LACBIDRAFT_331052 [Laccaria bicolor S238N-H82]EDR03904.1 predicted protein [Laccaria bicolor S238N-H82]|eukprot:XP_001885472.1 predicted protein [Laccaria bicolor S238N-H82]